MISPKLLKLIIESIIGSLVKLVNKSISEQTYPNALKIAKIIPIHKSGNKQDMNNYRPISILSCFNKIFEKILQYALVRHIENNNILYRNQFGFRKYHSTIDALIATHDYIIENLDKNKKIMGIFIDLKKAFDSIDPQILIQKLEYYGITGPFQKIIESYLTDRKMYTTIQNYSSGTRPIKYGVPQGSVLGPILFTIYINDIKNLSKSDEIKLFADDTSIFSTGETYSELEENANKSLNECQEWLLINRLSLNIDKTQYMVFNRSESKIKLNLAIGSIPIKQTSNTKYLGLTMQDNLKWNIHINNTINKLNKMIPLFYSIKKILPKNKLILVYKSLAMSVINYAIELYGRKNNVWLKQMQKTQNRLLKILTSSAKLTSTNKLHKELNILKISDHAQVRLCLLIHKIMYANGGELPYSMKNAITTGEDIHKRNTRSKYNIYLTNNSFKMKNKIIDEAAIVWNKLPNLTKTVSNRNLFKEKLNGLFIRSYETK